MRPLLLLCSLGAVLAFLIFIHGPTIINGPRPARSASPSESVAAPAEAPPRQTAGLTYEDSPVPDLDGQLTTKLSTPPDPRKALGKLLEAVWDEEGSPPEGYRLGASSGQMRHDLHLAFLRPPAQVEAIDSPHPGTSGLFTAHVTDEQGMKGIVGVRLLRLTDFEAAWEIESLVIISSPR